MRVVFFLDIKVKHLNESGPDVLCVTSEAGRARTDDDQIMSSGL